MSSRIQQWSNIIEPDALCGWSLIISDVYNKSHMEFKHRPGNVQLVFFRQRTWFSFQVSEVKGWQLGGGEHLKDFLKKKKKERSARKRSQAAITTACSSDGGDNVRSAANRKLALWTSVHPVFLHLEPKAAEQKSLTSFKGVSQGSRKGGIQEGAGKCTTQSALAAFFCLFHFSWLFGCFF